MPFEATADVVIVPGISLRTDISGSDCNYLRDVIRQLDRYAHAAGIRPSTARITIVGGSNRTGFHRQIFYLPGDSHSWRENPEVRAKLFALLISLRFNLPRPDSEVKLFDWIVCGIDAELEAADTSGQHLVSNREYFLLSGFAANAGKLPDFAVMSRIGRSPDPVLQEFIGAQARILLQILAANGKLQELFRRNFQGAAPDCFMEFYTSGEVAVDELNAAAERFIWNRQRPIPAAAALARISAMEKIMIQKVDENGELTGDFEEVSWQELSARLAVERRDKAIIRNRFAKQFTDFARLCGDAERDLCALAAAAARELDGTPEKNAAFLNALNNLRSAITRRQAIERFFCDAMLLNSPLPDHFHRHFQAAKVENTGCSEEQMRFLQRILNEYLSR